MPQLFYKRHIDTLIDIFGDLDSVERELNHNQLTMDHLRAAELYAKARSYVHVVDTIPLPRKLRPAARAVADAAWLLAQMIEPVAIVDAEDELRPVGEARKYGGIQPSETHFQPDAFDRYADYMEKARTLLAIPVPA
ncbi:MAG: hypothetical protein LBS17_07045 [Actinomycetes bacterium]|jgi:hypothetical protein|nr:hypothetical protein [Actinomycetes bacterium]